MIINMCEKKIDGDRNCIVALAAPVSLGRARSSLTWPVQTIAELLTELHLFCAQLLLTQPLSNSLHSECLLCRPGDVGQLKRDFWGEIPHLWRLFIE